MRRIGLENVLKRAGRFLATSIIAAYTTLPVLSQETQRIGVSKNGSWNETYDTTLYFRDQKNGLATIDPKKNKNDQSSARVYFKGRITEDGFLDFTYSTTDLDNPKPNSPYFDPAQSKLYLLAMPGVREENVKQMIAIQKASGEVVFENLVQPKDANGFYVGMGRKMLEKLAQNDPLSKTKALTFGIVDISSTNILYFLNESVDRTGRKNVRPYNDYVEITEIPYWALDKWDATVGTEVGRRVILKLDSQKPKEKISIHHSLRIHGGGNFKKDEGQFIAYTQPFEIPTTSAYATTNSNPYAGVWFSEKLSDKEKALVTVFITSEGNLFLLPLGGDPRQGGRTRMSKLITTGEKPTLLGTRIEPNLKITETGKEEGDKDDMKINFINNNSFELTPETSDRKTETIIFKKLENW